MEGTVESKGKEKGIKKEDDWETRERAGKGGGIEARNHR